MTTKYGITQLPLGYPVFYVGSKDEWVSENEFASKMPKLFSQFIQNKVEEKMLVAFTNSKVATGGVGTALLFVYVSVIGDDAYIRGVKKIGTYKNPPSSKSKNEAHIQLLSHEDGFKYPHGWRYYAGDEIDMGFIREVIEGWMLGLINKSGSAPDYDGVRAF